jgi:hypothetical protein
MTVKERIEMLEWAEKKLEEEKAKGNTGNEMRKDQYRKIIAKQIHEMGKM